MKKKGFVLPFTLILSLILLTSVAFWYRQTVMKSLLATRLLEQRLQYVECRSLVPYVKEKLSKLDPDALLVGKDRFLTIEIDQQLRWEIDRSAFKNGKVKLTFHQLAGSNDAIQLLIDYDPT